MKFDIYDDKYLVFLNRDFIKDIDFKIKNQVEECFRKVFTKMKNRTENDLSGFFNIKVYLNNDFGAILIIDKENSEYYDYYSLQIDMQIEIEYDALILLEFNELFDIKNNIDNIYFYKDKYYIKYNNDINYLEFSNIIYGKNADEVLKNGVTLYNVCDI